MRFFARQQADATKTKGIQVITVKVELEHWSGSPVIRTMNGSYRKIPANEYRDAAAALSPRQAIFYRNLIRLAEVLKTNVIPAEFELPSGEQMFLDRGCVKIAEIAGFIRPLSNDSAGVVSKVMLNFEA